ncbi:MAG: hypothetical protein IT291_00905 [Deltaproteobacteria bacterium]|nr:hypothetical protein [Deltaproteobacteria bacterium]
MASTHAKLDEALSNLIEAYAELEEEIDQRFGDDEDAFEHKIIEVLETSIETALENQDASTNLFATIVSALSEALEQMDPTAFDEEEEDSIDYSFEEDEIDYDDEDGDDEEEDDSGDIDDDEE